jgi:hypothetical protein
MKMLFGLLLAGLMLGGVFYQLVFGNLLGRDWRPLTSRDESPVVYWAAITIEAAGGSAVLYGVLHDAR